MDSLEQFTDVVRWTSAEKESGPKSIRRGIGASPFSNHCGGEAPDGKRGRSLRPLAGGGLPH